MPTTYEYLMKILIIHGHPDPMSYCRALAAAYRNGAMAAGAEVKEVLLGDLRFDPVLHFGYRQRMELEPDLNMAWEQILWAEHLVWVYPVWWGSMPALMKGFIDRLFLPGMAFKKREGSLLWDKFLTGRTARIISTMDQPAWYYRIYYRQPSHHAMKKAVLEFCGVKPVRVTAIGPLRLSKPEFRQRWLNRVEALGRRQG